MRKTAALIIALTFILAAFAGCSGGKDTSTDIVPATAAATLLNEITFKDTLVEVPGDVAKEWYRFDDNVTDFAIYKSGSGATAEEIAVIKTSDLKTAEATVQKRVDDLEFSFKDYVPAELTKINDPVIVSKGDIVVLVLADDSSAAQKSVDALFE